MDNFMPQPNAARQPLPMPGVATTSITTVSKTQLPMGNIAACLYPFEQNLGNAVNNTSTEAIINCVAQSGAQHHLIAATIVSVGCSRLNLCPLQWDNDLVATHLKLNGKLFALEGDLINNNGYLVELPDLVFNLVTNAYAAPTNPTIVLPWVITPHYNKWVHKQPMMWAPRLSRLNALCQYLILRLICG